MTFIKRKPKAALIFLAAALMLNSVCFAADEKTDAVYAVFDTAPVFGNLTAEIGAKNEITTGFYDGKYGWTLSPDNGVNGRYINFIFDRSKAKKLSGDKSVAVEIEYFDEGDGSFVLEYTDKSGAVKNSEMVLLNNTRQWKTYTFLLTNASFVKGIDKKYDIRFAIWSATMGYSFDNVTVHSAAFREADTVSGMEIVPKTEKIGNIFFEGQTVDYEFEINTSRLGSILKRESADVNVIYTVSDDSGTVVSREEKAEKLKLNGTDTLSYSFKPEKFDLYKMQIEITSEKDKIYEKKISDFSYVVKQKSKNLNYHMGTMGSTYTEKNYELAELTANAGIGYIRSTYHVNALDRGEKAWEMLTIHHKRNSDYTKNNLKILSCFTASTNYEFEEGMHSPATPVSRAVYNDYIKYFVSKSKNVSNDFEVWNEWNLKNSTFNRHNLEVEDYYLTLKEAYAAAKSVNPDCNIVGGVTSGDDYPWAEKLLDLGGGEYFDTYSLHPYRWSMDPISGTIYERTKAIKDLIAQKGYPDKKIWLSEIGWTSNFEGITDYSQGWYNACLYAMLREDDVVDCTFYYCFEDPTVKRNDRESNFGMVRSANDKERPYAAKPGYLCIAQANAMFTDAEFVKRIDVNDDTRLYQFSRAYDGKNAALMFSRTQNDVVSVKTDTDELNVYDEYGNKTVYKSDDGIYTFALDQRPNYIEGDFTSLEVCENKFEISSLNFDAVNNDTITLSIKKPDTVTCEPKLTLRDKSACEIIENSGFDANTNTAVIKIKALSSLSSEESIGLTLEDNGNTYFKGDIKLSFKAAADMYITRRLNESGRWVITAEIDNNSSVQRITGDVTVNLPESIVKTPKITKSVTVNPSSANTIELEIPPFSYEGGVGASVIFSPNGHNTKAGNIVLENSGIPYVDASNIEIDGDINDEGWSKAYKFKVDENTGIVNLNPLNAIYEGPDDITVSGAMAASGDGIYLMVDTLDNVHDNANAAADMWRGDSLQVGLVYDPKNTLETKDFTELAFGLLNGSEPAVCKDMTMSGTESDTDGIQYAIKRIDNHTYYEVMIPWRHFVNADVDTSNISDFKFSLLVNDADGKGRKLYAEFGSGIGNVKNSAQFKTMMTYR